jgi:hypothetical protein
MDSLTVVNAFRKVLNNETIDKTELTLIKDFILYRYLFCNAGEVLCDEIKNATVDTINQVVVDCLLQEIDNTIKNRYGK